jgi:hypothetical protein
MLQIWKLPKLALIHQWATNHSTGALASVVRQAALLHISGEGARRAHPCQISSSALMTFVLEGVGEGYADVCDNY